MNTGIDLFIADLPDNNGILGFETGGDAFKPYCIEHGGALTTPLSQSELDAILQVEDIDSSCQWMSIAAYGDGEFSNALTFYTDDGMTQQLPYKNWASGGFPVQPTNSLFEPFRCTWMDLGDGWNGVWKNEACNGSFLAIQNHCGLCRAPCTAGCGGGKLALLTENIVVIFRINLTFRFISFFNTHNLSL